MIQGNLLGLGMIVFAAIFVAIGHFLLKLPDVAVMSFAGLVVFAADAFFRLMRKEQDNWLFSKTSGGYLYFIPAWVFGIVVVAINLINYFFIKK